jgi:hypothetical protein
MIQSLEKALNIKMIDIDPLFIMNGPYVFI